MIFVTFALPDESRDFRAGLRNPTRSGPSHLPVVSGDCGGRPVRIIHTGVGESEAARREMRAAFETGRPRAVIIAGFAGALRPGVPVGAVVLGGNYTDPTLREPVGAALSGEPWHAGEFCTRSVTVETVEAKAALWRTTGAGALAVDMETAWIAAEAARVGVPTVALRVISDAADQDFPVPGGVMFDPVRQRPRYVALPFHLATHPGRIGPFVHFVRGLGPARATLARALGKVVVALAAQSPAISGATRDGPATARG